METGFSTLEKNILKAKGLNDEQLAALVEAGIRSRQDFETVGDEATLLELLPGLGSDAAAKVIQWAIGRSAAPVESAGPALPAKVIIDSADVVFCSFCNAKQPKDYKTGDLCPSCGKQAEPTQGCFWCMAVGPGKFCRQCAAEFVPTAEFDLAVLLKRDGLAKDEVPRRLRSMSQADKDQLWGRVRRHA